MSELTRTGFFETIYAGAAPGDQLLIQLVPQGVGPDKKPLKAGRPFFTEPGSPIFNQDDLDNKEMNCLFQLIPLNDQHLSQATCVFLDFDNDAGKTPLEELLTQLSPPPTAVVASGHGWHVYWALTRGAEPARALALGKLTSVTLGTDTTIYDTSRKSRVPGSWNVKKDKPLAYCELRILNDTLYELEDLEDHLIAMAMVPHWEQGQRDNLALGLGALFARASFDLGRIARVVTYIAQRTGDDELPARIATASKAITRKERGEVNSAKHLIDIVGMDLYRALVQAMGITSNDGNVVLGDSVIGRNDTLERDMSQFLDARGDWTLMDGDNLFWWNGKFWELRNKEALCGYVIGSLVESKIILNGTEQAVNYDSKLVGSIAQMIKETRAFYGAVNQAADLLFLSSDTLDLETGIRYPHAREHYNRWVLDFNYDVEAKCPVWLSFLDFATNGDKDVQRFLQDWAGYILTPGNPWQKMLWLYGGTGTGKSTFLRVLQSLLGPAHITLNPHKMNDYEVARLSGTLLATCSELDLQVMKTSKLKSLIGGDTTSARHPYGRPFDFRYDGKLAWASNGLPAPAESDGFYRRLVIVPFTNKPKEPDAFLSEKLLLERAGILNWAIEGWHRQADYRASGDWPTPEVVIRETLAYEAQSDITAMFFADQIEMVPDYFEPASGIYAAYKVWAQQQSFTPLPHSQKFNHELRKMGLIPTEPRRYGTEGRKVRGWLGARLRANKVIAPLTSEADAEHIIREARQLN